jgi:branched-chain amino acid transport system substrate-binding protein
MNRRNVLALSFAALALAGLPAAAFAQSNPVKVGVTQALSGPNADYFQRQTVNPVLMAVEELNAAGGLLGQKVEVVVEDHKGDPATSAAATRKLIDVNKISVLTTSVSPAVLAALPITEENKVIVMSLAQHPKITESKWNFRTGPIGTNYGIAMAKYAREKLGAKTIAMLGENNDSIRLSQTAMKKAFEDAGGKIVASETFAPTDQDLRAQLTKIRAAEPDVLSLQSTGPRMHGLALKQAAEMKIKPSAVIANQTIIDPQLFAIAGDAASGVYYATVGVDKEWAERFKKRFGYDPVSEAALTYDGINKYFAAVKAVGSNDPVKIRDTLLSQAPSSGASGTWGYPGTGEPSITPEIQRIP